VEAITAFRTSVGSHERIGVVELFGRNSGETSLFAAYLADVHRALISEIENEASNPELEMLGRLATAPGARPRELFEE